MLAVFTAQGPAIRHSRRALLRVYQIRNLQVQRQVSLIVLRIASVL